jgi:rhodanese-related sulfurtransferase
MKARMVVSILILIIVLLIIAGSCASDKKTIDASNARDYTQYHDLAVLINKQTIPYVLVDVRSHAAYCDGHIPTAINIPSYGFEDNLPTTDKNALIIVYCQGGISSASAADTLKGLGYTNIVDFGGWPKWEGDLVKCD